MFHRHGAQAVYLVACGVLAAGWLLTSLAQAAVRLLGLRSGCGAAYERVGVLEMNALQECEEARPAA